MGLFDYPKSSEMAQRMLDEFTFLGEASSEDWDIIRAHVETKNFGAGEKLVRYGEIDTSFFILTEGTVEIVVEQSDGEPHVLSNIPKGSVFGPPRKLARSKTTSFIQLSNSVELDTSNSACSWS